MSSRYELKRNHVRILKPKGTGNNRLSRGSHCCYYYGSYYYGCRVLLLTVVFLLSLLLLLKVVLDVGPVVVKRGLCNLLYLLFTFFYLSTTDSHLHYEVDYPLIKTLMITLYSSWVIRSHTSFWL